MAVHPLGTVAPPVDAAVGRLLAGAGLWSRLEQPSAGAERPFVLVAGWDAGHPGCTPEALVAAVLRSGRALADRCPSGGRLLAFPAPAGSRTSVAVLHLDAEPGATVLAAAHHLRSPDGLVAWQAGQRSRSAERRSTAAAALAQMVDTTEAFHRLYAEANRDRAVAESSATRLDSLARETLRDSDLARSQVAARLHDRAGQSAVSAHRFLEAARAALDAGRPQQAASHLDAAGEQLLEAMREIRAVLDELVPPGLEELGVAAALRSYVERSVPPPIAAEVTGSLPRAARWLEAGLFAMTAEAITNAVLHAAPSSVRIDLRTSRGRGIITVTDDGIGFDPAAARRRTQEGMGLIGMARRASWLGGRVDVTSRPADGATIRITVPLEEPEGGPGHEAAAARGRG